MHYYCSAAIIRVVAYSKSSFQNAHTHQVHPHCHPLWCRCSGGVVFVFVNVLIVFQNDVVACHPLWCGCSAGVVDISSPRKLLRKAPQLLKRPSGKVRE